jgi:hypothetical protein
MEFLFDPMRDYLKAFCRACYLQWPHLTWLDAFTADVKHQWCIGAEVNVGSEKGIRYYVMLGYVNQKPDDLFQRTAYYYWLQCEPYLQIILPAIHAVHFDSAKAWNAMAQSLRPLHFRTVNKDGGKIGARRRYIQRAMSSVDIGSLLRRAVRMYAEPVYRIDKIAERISSVWLSLQESVNAQESPRLISHESGNAILDIFPQELPISFYNEILEIDRAKYCALPLALIEFIVYECLCNALSYYKDGTDIKLVVALQRKAKEQPYVIVRIENERHEVRDVKLKTSGLPAYRMAAQAAQGIFDSKPLDHNIDIWQAIFEIPVHEVPTELEEQLHAKLKNR